MLRSDLIEGMGYIDDDLAEEACVQTTLSGWRSPGRWLAIATCVAIAALVGWGIMRGGKVEVSQVAEAADNTPTGEELVQTDRAYPYASLDTSRIASVVFNWGSCDPWELPEEKWDEFLAALRQLYIDPQEIVTEERLDGYGDTGWQEDLFVVMLTDGTSFMVAPRGGNSDYDYIVYIDGQPRSSKWESARDLYTLYREYVGIVRELNGLNDRIPQFDIEDAPQTPEELEDMFSDFVNAMRGGGN